MTAPMQSLIGSRIRDLRNQKILLDADLASLYGVQTRRLNEQVRRNRARFPEDFIFELTPDEFANLKSQNATSSWGGRRKLPLAFTEHGAIMAATVLNTPRAVEVSVYVVRAFVQLRELAITHRDLAIRLDTLEQKTQALAHQHDSFSRNTRIQLKQVFDTLRELMTPPDPPTVQFKKCSTIMSRSSPRNHRSIFLGNTWLSSHHYPCTNQQVRRDLLW